MRNDEMILSFVVTFIWCEREIKEFNACSASRCLRRCLRLTKRLLIISG